MKKITLFFYTVVRSVTDFVSAHSYPFFFGALLERDAAQNFWPISIGLVGLYAHVFVGFFVSGMTSAAAVEEGRRIVRVCPTKARVESAI